MKTFVAVLIVAGLASFDLATAGRCKRGTRQCLVNDTAAGTSDLVDYEGCTHYCCGAAIYERDVYFQCCGDETYGIPYNPVTQLCCTWPYGREFVVYNRSNVTDGAYCCGTDLFDSVNNPSQSCCNGYLNRPQAFDHLTEMCCNGNRQFSNDTAYTSCCGDNSFDRRSASCPCHDGIVGVGIPEQHQGCCYSRNGQTRGPYNTLTEECCDGVGYNKESEFCCGGVIGAHDSQTCCGDVIQTRSGDLAGEDVGCCVLADGTSQVYNMNTSICCGNNVLSRDTITGDAICCGNTLYNVAESGDACCGDVPYSSDSGVCCNGVVGFGDSCCDGQAFASDGQICCAGQVNAHNYVVPGCCVNQTFDSYTQTCCGLSIFENPLVSDGLGGFNISHHTRCCGDFSNDNTLVPYDYQTQTCCSGNIIDLNELPWESAECCGSDVIDREIYTCCDGNRVENIYGSEGRCCGSELVNSTRTLCCDGVARDFTSQGGEPVCCGSSVIDRTQEICCDGVARSLNGVAPDKAICCGDGCIDGTTYWCCDGKQYQKGATNGVAVSGLTCNDLFG